MFPDWLISAGPESTLRQPWISGHRTAPVTALIVP